MAATVIEITFKELREYLEENGYIIALYEKKQDGNWHLTRKTFDAFDVFDIVNSDTVLLASNFKGYTNMKETVTIDKKYLFKLHNNYNLPEIIPCFPEN